GKEIQSYLIDLQIEGGAVEIVGFLDDRKPPCDWNGTRLLGGLEILGVILRDQSPDEVSYITAIGENHTRRRIVEKISLLAAGKLMPWTLRHSRANVGQNVEVGVGTCLAPGSIVTANARIGSHVILNVNSSVSHDAIIGDFANINPGAVIAGNVNVGAGAYVGAGATVIHGVSVGEWAVIGAGAVVIGDVPPHTTAVGVPARVIKHHG
ncbi:MAG: NeuD/PglB/VioB family sugar acetyltransferase, partial [Deltaproteobacteria bacterium]|nr:NeuD/PglB/VioB family sugar acetyltransferase [Deltaproteobacteria bacterium]